MNRATRIVIVVFLGIFGVHKFIDKNYKMGILYLLTGGLFGIGWIIDIFKEITGNNSNNVKSLMSKEILGMINRGQLPNISIKNINLKEGEICHYADSGYTYKDKTITTGYTGRSSGINVKLTKGLSYRTGGTGSKAIRETQRTTYAGTLVVTDKRVIYISTKDSFDKTFDKITSIVELEEGVLIQIGSASYAIIIPTHSEFMKVFNMIKNQKEKFELFRGE